MLGIEKGVTAIIGGGGKTTLLYTLAKELRSKGRVIICTSTRILVPERAVAVASDKDGIMEALSASGFVCAGTPAEKGKLKAALPSFSELAAMSDYVLVEADGARGLPLKAHAAHEPVIPENTGRVILVVGADGLGRPVREVCHRPEIWSGLSGIPIDRETSPEGESRVIAAEGLGDVVYINKTEKEREAFLAERLAAKLSRRVVLGSLRQGVYTQWS